mmetsp:Transcript_61255/g.158971  ORF Transcript_61255/g.158971 Transcript_61255/m.158971 type:complete len:215 (+) Transcript_61255:335-979(+)
MLEAGRAPEARARSGGPRARGAAARSALLHPLQLLQLRGRHLAHAVGPIEHVFLVARPGHPGRVGALHLEQRRLQCTERLLDLQHVHVVPRFTLGRLWRGGSSCRRGADRANVLALHAARRQGRHLRSARRARRRHAHWDQRRLRPRLRRWWVQHEGPHRRRILRAAGSEGGDPGVAPTSGEIELHLEALDLVHQVLLQLPEVLQGCRVGATEV